MPTLSGLAIGVASQRSKYGLPLSHGDDDAIDPAV
jgi:hypothetical protein